MSKKKPYHYRPGPHEPKGRYKKNMSTYLTWGKMTNMERPESWRLPVGLSQKAVKKHQPRARTATIIDNIKANPENISMVINYSVTTSKVDCRKRSVTDTKRRRRIIDLLKIVNENLNLDEMATQIIASEPMLNNSHLAVVIDAIRRAKQHMLRESVGLIRDDVMNQKLSGIARRRYQEQVSCMGLSSFLICGDQRIRPTKPPKPHPPPQTPPPPKNPYMTNARRQYMEDVYGYGLMPHLTHGRSVKPKTERKPYLAKTFVDNTAGSGNNMHSEHSMHRTVLTWPQSVPVSSKDVW